MPATLNVNEISFYKLEELVKDKEISNLRTFDFYNFDKLLRKYKSNCFNCYENYQAYKKQLLNDVKTGKCVPILLKETFDVMDKINIIAHKVLGIEPTVMEI